MSATHEQHTLSKDGWVNRFSSESGALSNSPSAWRLSRASLKNGTLSLSRPPHDLGIRSFDPSLTSPLSPLSGQSTPSLDSQSRLGHNSRRSGSSSNAEIAGNPDVSASSTPNTNAAANSSSSFGHRRGHLSYRGYDSHPDLVFDSQGALVGGSLESLAHTVIFGSDEQFVPLAVLCIAAVDDLIHGLDLMKQYVEMIRINAGGQVDDRTLEVSDSNVAVNFTRSSHAGHAEAVVTRVKLLINSILDSYRGMVLNSTIHASLQQLADSISCYDDHTSTQLKLQLYQQQQAMTNLLSYDNSEESHDVENHWGPSSSSISNDPADHISDRLKSLFARVDAALAASNTAQLSVASPNINSQSNPGSPQQSKTLNISSNTARISTITPDIFLELTSTDLFATQIAAFHLRFYQKWSPESDISLLFPLDLNYTSFNPLVFDAKRPHFLGNLLIDHILSDKYGSLDAAQRGTLLIHWINLGSSLRSLGDLVGWIAIVSVICSQPILRLRESWAYVSPELREMVGKEWGHELFELDRRSRMDLMAKRTFRVSTEEIGVTYPKERSVSYFGDLLITYVFSPLFTHDMKTNELTRQMETPTFASTEERINRVKVVINSWKYFFDRIPQIDSFPPAPRTVAPVQKLLSNLLVMHADSTNYSEDDLVRMSLAVEPSAAGAYAKLPLITTLPIAGGTYLPVLFPSTNSVLRIFSEANTLHAALGFAFPNAQGRRSTRSVSRADTHSGQSSGFPASSPSLRFSPSLTNLQRTNSIPTTSTNSPSTPNLSGVRPSTPSGGIPTSPSTIGFGKIYGTIAEPVQQSILASGILDLEVAARDFFMRYNGNHSLMQLFCDYFNVEAKLYRVGKDIVLKAVPMQQMFERHMAVATSENVIDVVVKSATVERMIDVLVLGVHGFSRLVAEEDVHSPNLEFRIDMNVHTLTFFATFRSFCTPLELLAALRRRFLGVKAAAISLIEGPGNNDKDFPNWRATGDIDLENNRTWSLVAQIQIGIIEACHLWVSHYFNDFADDRILWRQFLELVELFSSEISLWKSSKKTAEINSEYRRYLETMESLYKKVRNLFYKKTYRPNHVRPLIVSGPVGSRIENLFAGSKDSTIKLEKLVDDINTYAYELFAAISIKDWMETFETLELQAASSSGFFQYTNSSSTNEDDVVIEDIFTYMETAFINKTESKLIERFPRAVQELFRLHRNIVSYISYQVADPFINREGRIARMMSVMKMLGITRARMNLLTIVPRDDDFESFSRSSQDGFGSSLGNLSISGAANITSASHGMTPHIPGFVEQSIMSAIVRPESRMFSNAWIEAGRELARIYRGISATDNTTEVFIPAIDPAMLRHGRSMRPAVPCPGWIMERMIELCGCVPNTCANQNKHINFDKRRFVYGFLSQVIDLNLYNPFSTDHNNDDGSLTASIARKLAYVLNPDQTLYYLEKKALKEALNRELKELPRGSSKIRVFTKYTLAQVEKVKRDTKQRDIHDKQLRELKRNGVKTRSGSSLGIYGSSTPGSSGASLSGQSVNGGSIGPGNKQRSRFGGLLRAVRPISMAFSGGFTPTNDRMVAVSELPDLDTFAPSRFKQLQDVNLTHARIFEGIPGGVNRGEVFVFKVITEEGVEHIFQAPTETEAAEWVACISKCIEEANERYNRSLPKSTKVFGVPIEELCNREGTQIPTVVTMLLKEIEARGLDEVGLYRVSGSLVSVNALKQSFDSGEPVDMEDERWYDINTLAGCFKLYLRELSEPLLTEHHFADFVKCGNEIQPDADENQLERLKSCIDKLPTANYHLLKRLMAHLALVAEHESNNKMKTPNLAIVFSMSFLPSGAVDHMRSIQNVVNTMIVNHAKLFDETHTRITTASLTSPVMSGSESQPDSIASISGGTIEGDSQPQSPAPVCEESVEPPVSNARESAVSEGTYLPSSATDDSDNAESDDRAVPLGGSGTNRDSMTEVSAY